WSPRASRCRTRSRLSETSAVSSGRDSSSRGPWPTRRSSSTSRARRSSTTPTPVLHSHDALDRPGGFSGVNLLVPLRHRDFRLLWAGMTISLLGDGIFLVALAWQTYELWNAPGAMAVVGIAMTVPTVAFLLPAGVLSDRLDRRSLMLGADAFRLASVAVLALLALTDALRLWELVVLVAAYGVGTAFFTPAFEALVPALLPNDDLPAANSLD